MSDPQINISKPLPPTPVCGIGASAGGVAALQALFRGLQPDLGLAYVVILHLAPDQPSALSDILRACTGMPVSQVADAPTLHPNCVYVIPPDRELLIEGDSITAREFAEPRGRRAPIDMFFRSVAAARGDGIAVILTGAGADGASGVKAIKEGGGIVMVQEPAEAAFPMMPQNAIATGAVDFIGSIHGIAERIAEVAQSKEAVRSLETDDTANDLRRIIGFLRTRTGHDFSSYKRATVLRRVMRRMQVTRCNDLAAYADMLRRVPEEAKELFSDLLISVTMFFRDAGAFQLLETRAISAIFDQANEDEGIRAWVVGCATGEEAYSIAMLLLEEAGRRRSAVPIQIFASDLDEEALATARDGRYPRDIEIDMSEERLRRFFVDEGTHYRVRKEIRDLVLFASHSVLKDPPFTRLNLVSCRNLLIYLERSLQQQLCSIFHYALRPDGYLFLGSAETAESMTDRFLPVDREARLYQAKPRASQPLPMMSQVDRLVAPPRPAEASRADGAARFSAAHEAALEKFSPPSVLVDEGNAILNMSASAGRFILHGGGPISSNLAAIVRPELRLDLGLALGRAFSRLPTLTHPVPVRFDAELRRIALNVQPVVTDDRTAPRAIVFFLDSGPARPEEEIAADDTRPDEIRRLQGELKAAQEALVVSRHEHEVSVQDLRAANEELQSINEEYRSTAEELETSKEELQSINEELHTVNAELKHKLEGISVAHGDLRNITATTEIGTLFLDTELRIRLFTPPVAELVNITEKDVGRLITDFTHRLEYGAIEADAQRVLRNLSPLDREVRGRDGRWYVVRIRPYRTLEDRINGVVLSFVDVTARHKAETKLAESQRQLHALIDASFQVVYRMDPDWKQMRELIGGGFLADTRSPSDNWLTHYIPPDEQPEVQRAIDRAIATKSVFDLEHRVNRSDGGVGWTHSRAVPLLDPETGEILEWFGSAADITARHEAEKALGDSERRYRVLIEGVAQLVFIAEDGGRWSWSSSQWHAYSGQTERESRGLGWMRAVHPDDRELVMAAWKEAGEKGLLEVEYRIGNAQQNYRWFRTRATPSHDLQGRVREWLGTSTDVDDLRQLQENQSVMVSELQHRTRNLIAVVRSISDQTIGSTPDVAGFRAKFNLRLAALARVQGLLSRSDEEPITIGTLVRSELAAVLGTAMDPGRVTLRGPEIVLRNRDVQTFALAIHELATNAQKYGAFASPTGRLSVTWQTHNDGSGGDRVCLDWVEDGIVGRSASETPGGYGRELIERALPYSLGARTSYVIGREQVRCSIELPRERFSKA
ncbi:PAS domain S-box protein [Rhodovarius crocodyli]|uniref:PAS domain S-box protein n=1 Tax=Rhodovarius crocodyli TaxID=1979269 RepID=A0A437MDQ8_9PROT|nr:chemotaxis protein CheB [Rhodovarius crocodyli]RVT95794.1 PAS domain S-box protein [Rhodovarius crocodyli]